MLAAAKQLGILGTETLFQNAVELVRVELTHTLTNGTPRKSYTVTDTRWSGMGSLQYVRPRIQKPFPDTVSGTWEDPVAFVAYLPFGAAPTIEDTLRDVDGILGDANGLYTMSRTPANVAGMSVYWECYLGVATNA